jgi:RNA-binding motif protein, X-linked 2
VEAVRRQSKLVFSEDYTPSTTMNSIRRTEALNNRELEDCTPVEASWHKDYADTAFIYIGGLDERLTEGDVITIFSQYGEPVYLNLVRDKETGKSRGFAFLKYEDQRSCDLAVDNLGGAKVMERYLNVDHTRYKKRDDEDLTDNTRGFGQDPAIDQGAPRQDANDETEKEEDDSEPERPLLREEIELQKLLEMDDEDPMKLSLIESKKEEVNAALKKLNSKRKHRSERKHRRHSHHSSHRKSKSTKSSKDDHRERRSRHHSRSPPRRNP